MGIAEIERLARKSPPGEVVKLGPPGSQDLVVLMNAAAALLGSLIVTRLWQAVQARAALPAIDRPATFAYIDEFQDYLHLPTGVEAMLAQARSLGLGLTLAHQHLGQLSASVREAVLANARSRVIFQVAASDANTLVRELAPLSAADLQGLGRFEVVARLSAGGQTAPPVRCPLRLGRDRRRGRGGNPGAVSGCVVTTWSPPFTPGTPADWPQDR